MKLRQFKAGDLIGFRKDGRPIYLIGGGSGEDEGGDDGTDTGDDGQDGDDNGQQGEDDLLGGDHGNDGQGDDGGSGDSDQVTMSRQELDDYVSDVANRVADKRINQALQTRRRKKQSTTPRQDDDGSDRGTSVADADMREARLVYREYVSDAIKFGSREERSAAADLARLHIEAAIAGGGDVESAGQDAAEKVAERVKALRSVYQRQMLATLKQRKVIPEDYQPSQSGRQVSARSGGGSSPVETSNPTLNAQYGRDLAKRLVPQPASDNRN